MTISGDGAHDGIPFEYMLPLYPGEVPHDEGEEIWAFTDSAMLDRFEAAMLDHMPKVLRSARRLAAAGWKLRMTIEGISCAPPEDVDCWDYSDEDGDIADDYAERLGLPIRPVNACGMARSYPEIVEAASETCDRVWYERSVRHMVQTSDDPVNPFRPVLDTTVESGAMKAQMRMESRYGKESLEEVVDDPFEAGMINGKLSALRWVMGDPWDTLDT